MFFYSCKKEKVSFPGTPNIDNPCQNCNNQPPVANAGPDQTQAEDVVYLDGSKSTDPNNNIRSYYWRMITGSQTASIINKDSVRTEVNGLWYGLYRFELTVTDSIGLSDRDTVMVNVTNQASSYWVNINIPSLSIQYSGTENFYQSYGAAVATGKSVFFAGGSDDFTPYGGSYADGFEYIPQSKTFRNFQLSVPRSFLAAALVGNKILFAGGEDNNTYLNKPVYNTVDIYDTLSLNRSTAALSEARSNLAAVASGKSAYFIGGKTKTGFSNKMDIYNSDNNSWQVITMPRERGFAGAAIIGDNIYIAGGQNNSGSLNTVDIYNMVSGQWSSIEAPNTHPFANVISINNKLIIAGGDGGNNRAADIYNTTTGQWTTVTLSSSRYKMTVASLKNKIVFMGGAYSYSDGNFFNETGGIDVYDDATGTWSVGSVSPDVCGMMAATVGSQIIYVGFMWGNGTTTTNTMIIISDN